MNKYGSDYKERRDFFFKAKEYLGIPGLPNSLTFREAIVLDLRFAVNYCKGLTYKRIGKQLGIWPESARRIEIRALRKIAQKYYGEKRKVKQNGRTENDTAPTPNSTH